MRRLWLLAVAPLLLMMSSAHAGLVPTNVVVMPEGDTSNYRFCYSVTLQSQSVLQPGDYFTIYDFAGRVDGSQWQPEGFTFSTSKVGFTPDKTHPNDDPNIDNLTWTYTGEALINGERYLGQFCILSTIPYTTTDDFTGQTRKPDGSEFNNNITDTTVPVPSPVPEPSTWLLAGFGMATAAGMCLYRRRFGAHSAV